MAVIHFGNPHWTARGEAVVVPAKLTSCVGERAIGVERFVGEVVVCAPMELIGARSHGDVEDASACLAEFSGIVTSLHRVFLDRIHARLGHGIKDLPQTVGCVLALDARVLRVSGSAIQANGLNYVLTLDGVIASRGGIPLVEGGRIVGGIGCSGGAGSQDEVACKAGLAALQK